MYASIQPFVYTYFDQLFKLHKQLQCAAKMSWFTLLILGYIPKVIISAPQHDNYTFDENEIVYRP